MRAAQEFRQSGQDLVEFAITLPVFMLIILAFFDLGRAVYSYSALQNATREGARYAIVHPCVATGTISNIIKARAMAVDPASINVNAVIWGKDTVRVSSRMGLRAITPFVAVFLPTDPLDGTRKIIVTSSATMQRESWASPDCGT